MRTQVANEVQAYFLDNQTVVGTLWQAEGDRIRCYACGHRCLIGEGLRGICKVRFNREGQLQVPFGYVAGLQCDPAANPPTRPTTADQLVATALRERARLVVSSYNEPLITAEWAVAVFQQALAAGLECAFVSN